MISADRAAQPLSVTAIVACHNHLEFLSDALSSIVGQATDGAVSVEQIIVVDDGSADDPASIVRPFDPPVTLVRHPHRRGIAAARNTGWGNVHTDAIAFLDADDVWTPGSLAIRARVLQNNSAVSIAFGRAQIFSDEHRGPTESVRLPGTMLMRTTARDTVGGFDESLTVGETIDWVARAVHLGLRFEAVEHTVLLRRSHPTNTTRDHTAVHSDLLRVARAASARRR